MNKLLALLIICLPLTLSAQRDPTLAPTSANGSGAAGTSLDLIPFGKDGMAVVVRDGVPYLVDGTRLYGVGQQLGNAKIERITETEVWLRSGKTLRKLQRFSGIERKPAAKAKGSTP